MKFNYRLTLSYTILIITLIVQEAQSKNQYKYFKKENRHNNISKRYYKANHNYVPGKYYTVDYFGAPETYFVTPKDKKEYKLDAYLHRHWDEDDIFDKMYYDRPKGAILSHFAERIPDDDYNNVY